MVSYLIHRPQIEIWLQTDPERPVLDFKILKNYNYLIRFKTEKDLHLGASKFHFNLNLFFCKIKGNYDKH